MNFHITAFADNMTGFETARFTVTYVSQTGNVSWFLLPSSRLSLGMGLLAGPLRLLVEIVEITYLTPPFLSSRLINF